MMFVLVLLVMSNAIATRKYAWLKQYQSFVPKIKSQHFANPSDVYASEALVSVQWSGETYDLQLSLNRDLLSEDWELKSYDDDGNLIEHNLTRNDFMCHYTGTVLGHNFSHVYMSMCDGLGMRGLLTMGDLALEVMHAVDPSVKHQRKFHSQEHIIFDSSSLDYEPLPLDALPPTEITEVESNKPENTPRLRATRYVASHPVLTDASRLNQFSSRSAEALDAQAIINGANSLYGSTSWSNSDRFSLRLIANIQNPTDFRRDVNTINTVYTWKSNNYPREATVVAMIGMGLRSGAAGVGCTGCMCTTTGSNLNEVQSSQSLQLSATLIAHETGHNWCLTHDSDSQGGFGFVMWPGLINNVRRFSSFSVTTMRNYRFPSCVS